MRALDDNEIVMLCCSMERMHFLGSDKPQLRLQRTLHKELKRRDPARYEALVAAGELLRLVKNKAET